LRYAVGGSDVVLQVWSDGLLDESKVAQEVYHLVNEAKAKIGANNIDADAVTLFCGNAVLPYAFAYVRACFAFSRSFLSPRSGFPTA
jgi:hypothetical protein